MIDIIIKWSGWLIAVSLAIWEIIRYVRNRYKVIVTISLEPIRKGAKENIVVIEALNLGRRPVKLTFGGIYFNKGPIVASDELGIELGWVYRKLPSYSFIKLKVLKDTVKSLSPPPHDVESDGICFLDESGDKHIGYFPENLRQSLYS